MRRLIYQTLDFDDGYVRPWTGRPMNEFPKVVFSETLARADWPQTRIASGDLTEEISRLNANEVGT